MSSRNIFNLRCCAHILTLYLILIKFKFATLSQIPDTTCRRTVMGLQYAGAVNRAKNGQYCLYWDDIYIYYPTNAVMNKIRDTANYPENQRNHNYCRNPVKDPKGPWCYLNGARYSAVNQEGERWAYCDVPICEKTNPASIKEESKPTSNSITLSAPNNVEKICRQNGDQIHNVDWTKLGDSAIFQCESDCSTNDLFIRGCNVYSKKSSICKASQHLGIPLGTAFKLIVSEAGFFSACTKFNIASTRFGYGTYNIYYAFQITTVIIPKPANGQLMLGNHSISMALPPSVPIDTGNECMKTIDTYAGKVNKTKSGQQCIAWTDRRIFWQSEDLRRKILDPQYFPGADIAHNFCRNPDNDPDGPWCYVRGSYNPSYSGRGPRYDYCDIPFCPIKQSPTGGHDGLGYFGSSKHCGRRKMDQVPVVRVIGGEPSVKGQWPWLVRLFSRYMCGGALIHPQWVLTAAHCFYDRVYGTLYNHVSNWKAAVGEYDTRTNESFNQFASIESIVIHRSYRLRSNEYDAALVKLAKPVLLSEYANIACLPHMDNIIPPGHRCYVAGWGKTENGRVSNIPRHVGLDVLSNIDCTLKSNRYIKDIFLCAYNGEAGKDSCLGDSGGPLMCQKDGQWLATGIVSHGRGCGVLGQPGMYTRISKLSHWIKEQIQRVG